MPSPDATKKSTRPTYGKRRAVVLLTVCTLMAAHLIHGLVGDRTLAPLELNEVMHTLELGVVTAGFLFMGLVLLATLIFGRFFCSWGCHILALEDACAWLLEKVGIRPRPIRSRLLLLIAPIALLYMFVWPQVKRLSVWLWPSTGEWIDPPPAFELRVLSDQDGWASFITSDFTRNLPGPGIAILTFATCGFLMVYLLGSRSFCRFACPYGTLFGLASRVSPGQILSTTECISCKKCTDTCTSGVVVHEEVAEFGKIVNPACLKDLDCVSVCSSGTLKYRFAQPTPLAPNSQGARKIATFDFTWKEEALMALLFLVGFAAFRGLYRIVPFLLSLGIGTCVAYMGVISLRLFSRESFRHLRMKLKTDGQLRRPGWIWAGFCLITLCFLAHSAKVRYHEAVGDRHFEVASAAWQEDGAVPEEALRLAIWHLEARSSWGIIRPPDISARIATLLSATGQPSLAIPHLRRQIADAPHHQQARLELSRALMQTGELSEASELLEEILGSEPSSTHKAQAHELQGTIALSKGRASDARNSYRLAVASDPDHLPAQLGLASALAGCNEIPGAIAILRNACSQHPEHAESHYNLAVLQAGAGQQSNAISSFQRALTLKPDDPQTLNNLGFLLTNAHQADDAERLLRRAIQVAPGYAEPHFNLGRLLEATGRLQQSRTHFQRAAALDARFAPETPKQTR